MADVEVKVGAEVIQKGILAPKNRLVITLTTLDDENLVNFDANFFSHFVFHLDQLVIADNSNVELYDHLVRVVGVV